MDRIVNLRVCTAGMKTSLSIWDIETGAVNGKEHSVIGWANEIGLGVDMLDGCYDSKTVWGEYED